MANPRVAAFERFANTFVRNKLICHNARARIDYVLNRILERFASNISDYVAAYLAATFNRTKYDSFIRGKTAVIDPLVTRLAAHVRLIAFDRARQWRSSWKVWSHRKTNAIHQK